MLASYEHELTFTGGQFERDKLAAQEKVIATHKEVIEGLESQLKTLATGQNVAAASKELEEAQARAREAGEALAAAQATIESLQAELQRRAMKGDFDPTDTKVIQFGYDWSFSFLRTSFTVCLLHAGTTLQRWRSRIGSRSLSAWATRTRP